MSSFSIIWKKNDFLIIMVNKKAINITKNMSAKEVNEVAQKTSHNHRF